MAWMIIRVRGTIHARHDILATLHALHLNRPNHATIVPEAPDYRGMLSKVQGYVTWGEADPATVELLLKERGVRADGSPLGAAEDVVGVGARVLAAGLPAAGTIRPLFRLRAPKGGWRSTKTSFAVGGALGYRGRAINDLARRML